MSQEITPFEQIRRTNPAGSEYWSSRDFAKVLGYVNYRHFVTVIAKAKTACFNSGQRIEDHFVGSDQMVEIGSGAQRPLKTVMMSRYACYIRKTIKELGGTMPEELPTVESIKKARIESSQDSEETEIVNTP